MIRRLRQVLAAAALVIATPAVANALVLHVLYNNTGRPPSIQTTDVVRAINQALREWEQHSNGQIIARYDGQTLSTSGPSDTIVIIWDTLAAGTCAHTCRRSLVGDCNGGGLPRGQIGLNLSMVNPIVADNLNPRWTPDPSNSWNRCRDLQSSLIHELAHHFEATGDHPPNSVLSYGIAEVSNRHLWTSDVNSIATSCSPITCYAPHTQQVRFQQLSPSSHTIFNTSDIPNSFPPRTPIDIATGTGQLTTNHNYAMVWGANNSSGTPGLTLAQGDASSWSLQHLPAIAGTPSVVRSTVRRPCVVTSNSGQHVYVVWTDPINNPELTSQNTDAGSSAAWSIESHDYGNTFYDPEEIPGLYFGGVSCSNDTLLDRVVVAIEGTDEGIWVSSRGARFYGPGNWSNPSKVTGFEFGPAPATRDLPYVIFDPFTANGTGRLIWFENTTLNHRMGVFGWNSFAQNYQLRSAPVERAAPVSMSWNTDEYLRGDPIMTLDGGDEVFYGTQSFNSTMTVFRQWNLSAGSTTSSTFDSWTFVPAPLAWVTGAGSNRVYFQEATANLMLLNPN